MQDVLWPRRGRGGGLSFQIPQIRILASARMEAGGLKALGAEPVELAAERGGVAARRAGPPPSLSKPPLGSRRARKRP